MLPRPAHYLILMILAGTGLSRAATLDDIGVNALRAVTNNLNGEGVWVAQPEGSLTLDELTWEINPANVGQNPAVFSYMADGGSANFYPNNLGTNSWHAEDVANIFYGRPAGIATNIAQVATFNADYFVTHFIAQALPPTTNFVIVNQSFIDNQLRKIEAARKRIDAQKKIDGRNIALQVDGGITPDTARRAVAAGATVLVAGTAVFTGGPSAYAANIKALRGC